MILRQRALNTPSRLTRSMARRLGITPTISFIENVTKSRYTPYKKRCEKRTRTKALQSDDEYARYITEWVKNYTRLKTRKGDLHFLVKPKVIDWCFPSSTFSLRLDPMREKKWGKSIIGYDTNQWTTKLGESILEETLMVLGKNPVRIRDRKNGENGKDLVPDFETDDALYECKARTYTTSGTAGEKILGTPWKYSECNRLYGKPLNIVCMAFQEREAGNEFCVFETTSHVRKKMLAFYEKEAGVKYVRFTDLLKEIVNYKL